MSRDDEQFSSASSRDEKLSNIMLANNACRIRSSTGCLSTVKEASFGAGYTRFVFRPRHAAHSRTTGTQLCEGGWNIVVKTKNKRLVRLARLI